jgi:LacI family transcriptional regulator
MAAERLIALGCQSLLFLHIGSSVPGEVNKRGDGFAAMCQIKQKNCKSLHLWDQDGVEGIRPFLKEHFSNGVRDFDGIFCCTDHLAHHVRLMLQDFGVRIPEDVQIIGFDGVRQFGEEALYCSTIVQPVVQMAETCVDLLLREDRSSLPSLICLPVTYLSGGTTKD